MDRDPHGQRIGRNSPCWCGSGKKFKYCHYKRESQRTANIGAYKNKFTEIEKVTAFCSCSFDAANCVTQIARAHTVSKGSSLNQISENGHVLTLEIADEKSIAEFKRVSANAASTVRAFCTDHDNKLFQQLDSLSFAEEPRFFWQLLYRSLCFERYKKLIATKLAQSMRELDRGWSREGQENWQDHVSRFSIAHALGFHDLDGFKTRLEKIFQDASFNDEIKFMYFQLDNRLSVAGTGVFQPDVAIDGSHLQTVNRFFKVEERFAGPKLDQLCMSILPYKNGSLLSFCCVKGDVRAEKFMMVFRDSVRSLVDNFIGVAVLKMENVFFRPSFVGALSTDAKKNLKLLHSWGVGEDVTPAQMKSATGMRFFQDEQSAECRHNLA